MSCRAQVLSRTSPVAFKSCRGFAIRGALFFVALLTRRGKASRSEAVRGNAMRGICYRAFDVLRLKSNTKRNISIHVKLKNRSRYRVFLSTQSKEFAPKFLYFLLKKRYRKIAKNSRKCLLYTL